MKKFLAVLTAACMLGCYAPSAAAVNEGKPADSAVITGTTLSETWQATEYTTSVTTATLAPEHTTTSTYFRGNEDYDFVGFVANLSSGIDCYVGDEIDWTSFRLGLWVFDPIGEFYRSDMIEAQFSAASERYAPCFTLDTSEVDFTKAGEYPVYIRTNPDVIHEFEQIGKSYYGLNSGIYRVKMAEHESKVMLSLREKPTKLFRKDSLNIVLNSYPSGYVGLYNFSDLEFSFEIANPEIVKIDRIVENGVYLWGLSAGTTTLTVTASDGRTEECTITVEPYVEPETTYEPTSVWFQIVSLPDKLTYEIGEELDFTGGYAEGYAHAQGIWFDAFTQPFTHYRIDSSDFDNTKPGVYEIRLTFEEECYFSETISYEVIVVRPGAGDVDEDSEVSISDAILLARVTTEDKSIELTPAGRENADFDSDGRLTVQDVVRILRKIAKL